MDGQPMSPAVGLKNPLWIGIAIVGVAAIAAAYFMYRGRPAPLPPAPAPVAVPQPGNPIEAAPDVNPIKRVNPFEDAYQNPFQ